FVVDVTEEVEPRAAAYWEMAGHSADEAATGIAGTCVEVLAVGDVPRQELAGLLAEEGVRVSDEAAPDARLTGVLTDDYIRQELDVINRLHTADGPTCTLSRACWSVL